MTVRDMITIKSYFETNDKPTQEQFSDLIDTLAEHGYKYSPKAFGAIWDSASHPLSERYATLAEAQAVYPHAVSLTDEIDWAATQAAINQVVLDNFAKGHDVPQDRWGGVVLLPGGKGRFNRELTLPYRDVYTLNKGVGVSLRGPGRALCTLEWFDNNASIAGTTRDDKCVIRFRVAGVTAGAVTWSTKPNDNSEMADVILEGFQLRGPGVFVTLTAPSSQANFITKYGFDAGVGWATAYNTTTPSIGQIYENYSGIGLPDRTALIDVQIAGFHKGIIWRGGQRVCKRLAVESCYYAVYVERNTAHHGDQIFLKCTFSARFACFGMAPGAGLFMGANGSFFGGSPFAFYKELVPGYTNDAAALATYGSHWSLNLSGSDLKYCQFEKIGNAIIAEGNVTRLYTVQDLTLEHCTYIYDSNFTMPAATSGLNGAIPNDALLDAKLIERFSLRMPHDPTRWIPKTVALIQCALAGRMLIEAADMLILAAATAGKRLIAAAGVNGGNDGAQIRLESSRYTGTYMQTTTSGGAFPSIIKGDLVGMVFNRIEQHSSGRAGVVGVALEANPNIATQNWIPVATSYHGRALINIEASATFSGDGVQVTYSTTEPGKVRQQTGVEPVLGRIQTAAGVGSPAQARVHFLMR